MKLRQAGSTLPFQPGKPVGNIYYGACSWTDRTLIDAGTFYAPSVRTAAERLAHYSSQFPIVEVDATYYALPSERNAHLWVDRTPPGFVFNIKAFGLFTHHPVVVERLPAGFRSSTPPVVAATSPLALVRFQGHNAQNYEKPNISGRLVRQGCGSVQPSPSARLRCTGNETVRRRKVRRYGALMSVPGGAAKSARSESA